MYVLSGRIVVFRNFMFQNVDFEFYYQTLILSIIVDSTFIYYSNDYRFGRVVSTSVIDHRWWWRGNIVTSHAAGPGLIPGRVNFLVEVFPGFSLNPKTDVRKFGSHSSPVIIWPSYTHRCGLVITSLPLT